MNYYKQGDAANADKIKAAFENKGFIKEDRSDIYENNVLFFTVDDDKNVHYCWIDQPYCNIVKTHPDYKELELPVEPKFKFKVGDWITCVDDDGDTSTEMIEDFWGDKVRLIDCDGVFTLYPKSELKQYHLWSIADAKDGDVLVTTKIRNCPFIYRKTDRKNNLAYYYAGIDGNGDFSEGCLKRTLCHFGLVSDVIPATKEQRDLLFQKIKEAGYEWDADKKELRKIKPHYDISNFKPFDKVLVRFCDGANWCCALFSHYCTRGNNHFVCSGGSVVQCIPFEGNEHLLGTTDMCDEIFINW